MKQLQWAVLPFIAVLLFGLRAESLMQTQQQDQTVQQQEATGGPQTNPDAATEPEPKWTGYTFFRGFKLRFTDGSAREFDAVKAYLSANSATTAGSAADVDFKLTAYTEFDSGAGTQNYEGKIPYIKIAYNKKYMGVYTFDLVSAPGPGGYYSDCFPVSRAEYEEFYAWSNHHVVANGIDVETKNPIELNQMFVQLWLDEDNGDKELCIGVGVRGATTSPQTTVRLRAALIGHNADFVKFTRFNYSTSGDYLDTGVVMYFYGKNANGTFDATDTSTGWSLTPDSVFVALQSMGFDQTLGSGTNENKFQVNKLELRIFKENSVGTDGVSGDNVYVVIKGIATKEAATFTNNQGPPHETEGWIVACKTENVCKKIASDELGGTCNGGCYWGD